MDLYKKIQNILDGNEKKYFSTVQKLVAFYFDEIEEQIKIESKRDILLKINQMILSNKNGANIFIKSTINENTFYTSLKRERKKRASNIDNELALRKKSLYHSNHIVNEEKQAFKGGSEKEIKKDGFKPNQKNEEAQKSSNSTKNSHIEKTNIMKLVDEINEKKGLGKIYENYEWLEDFTLYFPLHDGAIKKIIEDDFSKEKLDEMNLSRVDSDVFINTKKVSEYLTNIRYNKRKEEERKAKYEASTSDIDESNER